MAVEIPLERMRSSIRRSVGHKDKTTSSSRGAFVMALYLGAAPFFIAAFVASKAPDDLLKRVEISDANWTNGINKSDPSIIVVSDLVAKNLKPGDFILTPTGGKRAIKIELTPPYNHIHLSTALDFEKDGRVPEFAILKDGR